MLNYSSGDIRKTLKIRSVILKESQFKWQINEVQEESQGTIYSIKPMLAKLLITEGKYDQASEILNQIDNSKAKQIVYDELRYFRMKKTR